jgi:hypothetical protein
MQINIFRGKSMFLEASCRGKLMFNGKSFRGKLFRGKFLNSEANHCLEANYFRGRSLGLSSLGSHLDLLDVDASAFSILRSFKIKPL